MKENVSDEALKEKKYTEKRFLEEYIPRGLSTFSREVISKGVREGMHKGRLEYKWFGKPPDGYNLDKNNKLLKNDRVLLIELIFKKYDVIKNTAQIAFDLNKSGINSSKGKKWTATQVYRILTNPIYKGLYKVKDMEAYVPDYKIISSKLFDRVNKKLGKQKQSTISKERKEDTIDKIFNPYLERLKQLERPSDRIAEFKPPIDKESLFYPRENEPVLTRIEKVRLRLLIHLEEICKLLEEDKVLDKKSVNNLRQITDRLDKLFKKRMISGSPEKRGIVQESLKEERERIRQFAIEKRQFLDEVVR